MITRVCLRKNKTNEPQTLRDKQTCTLHLCTGLEEMVEQPRKGCEGMESSRATHILHHGVRGAQTSGNVMKNGMEGARCKGGDAFCHPEKSLYRLLGEVTKTLQQQPQQPSGSWFKVRQCRSRAGALPFSPRAQRDLLLPAMLQLHRKEYSVYLC